MLLVGDPPETRMRHPIQRRLAIRWLVVGSMLLIALAIAAGLTNYTRYFAGLLAGCLFVTTLCLGAVVYVLWQLRRGAADGSAMIRRPLEWLSNGFAYTTVAYIILVLAATHIWSLGETGPARQWYGQWFFVARTALYWFLWAGVGALILKASTEQDTTGSTKSLAKLGHVAPRMLVMVAITGTLVVLDWVVGLHREAPALWLAPFGAAHLLAGGVAAAVAIGYLVISGFATSGSVSDANADTARSAAGRWLAGAAIAWLVTGVVLAVAVEVSSDAPRAAWEAHAWTAGWRSWSLIDIGLHVVPILLVATPTLRKSIAGSVAASLLVLGHAAHAAQLVLPAAAGVGMPSWVELGGFATALVGVWLVLFQAISERSMVARPAPTPTT